MVTRTELAELLKSVRVDDVVRESGVSQKTVYRLRHTKHAPTLDTVERLLGAISRIRAKAKRARPHETKAAA
jgi:predicted transcriptional regulator